MKNRNTAPADEFKDPFLQQLLLERAIDLAKDRRLLPIRINTDTQRVMAAPLTVIVAGDHGEGTIVSFQLDAAGKASGWRLFHQAGINAIEWPLRMTITAADGEIVAGILRETSTAIERRYFPENWSEPR
ncbi:MAG: hypothetical protein JXR49_17575 [Acidobacteria bacterium]|nr:hypothetical protein [Acidobacteriota bacterium]